VIHATLEQMRLRDRAAVSHVDLQKNETDIELTDIEIETPFRAILFNRSILGDAVGQPF
jgi:hypothetical protein